MNSENSMNPPVGEPQSSEGRQRKRPRNPTQSPPMPSQESDIVSCSRHMEVGSASQEASHRPAYETWTEVSEAQLFEWLELPGHYDKWKCAGVKTSNGSTRTSGLTKKAVTVTISEYLDTVKTKKSPDQVMSKMRYVEKKYKEAEDYLRHTGEGLTSNDEKLERTEIRDKVVSMCPFYFRVKPFMCDRDAVNPPCIGETGMNENIEDMLFGNSCGQGFYESIAEEGGDGDPEEEDSSGDEEPESEDYACPETEPILHAPSQATPLVPKTTQHRPNPSQQPKEKKKKPKSIGELVADMQEQNRVLMEKKLDIHLMHQDEKLQFLREQSQKQFVLESRRLDLEFMRMEQQREDSRIRELALRVELEKLRANS